MSGIKTQDGPVAVTGASGYIGSRVVEDLLDEGYAVHACVRDASNSKKVDHLIELGKLQITIFNYLKEISLKKEAMMKHSWLCGCDSCRCR